MNEFDTYKIQSLLIPCSQDRNTAHSDQDSQKVKEKKEDLGVLIWPSLWAKQYLDRVKNAIKKDVFSESCFGVRVSFYRKSSWYLKTIKIF